MPDSRPEDLSYAEELINRGKIEEPLKIIRNFKKRGY